jgi:alkylated DNA repair dioxygenase AlkB
MKAIALTDALLYFDGSFFSAAQADQLMTELCEHTPWETHYVRMFGRELPAPRLSSWHGEPEAHYRYSQVDYQPKAWTAAQQTVLQKLHEVRIADHLLQFNSVLCNYYRSGADNMGWHSDSEAELGPDPIIASVNFGAARRFCLRHKKLALKHELLLTHGSLLIMASGTQRHWQHALPKAANVSQPRINLTFRKILR